MSDQGPSKDELDAFTFNDKGIRALVAMFGLSCFTVRMDNPEIDDHTFINEAIRRFRDGIDALELGEVGEYKTKLRSERKEPEPPDHDHSPDVVCGEDCPVYKWRQPMFPLPKMDNA